MRRTMLISLVLGLVLVAAAVSVALASGKQPPSHRAKHAHAVSARGAATSAVARHARKASASAVAARKVDGSDGDNVQQGDQSGPDNATAEESSSESSSESSPGDASSDGVEQAGNADHQCPPACAPGEK